MHSGPSESRRAGSEPQGLPSGFWRILECSRLLDDVYLRDYVFYRTDVGVPVCPLSVTLPRVPDRELGPLLIQLAQAGFQNPIIRAVVADDASVEGAAPVSEPRADLAEDWRLVREREGESYRWPEGREHYSRYRVFIGTTRAEGAVHIALGETLRENKWGRDRKYVVAFLSSGSPQQPLAQFAAADDFEETRELVAVVRGSDGARRMYGPGVCTSRPSTGNAFEPRCTASGLSIVASGTRSSSSQGRTTTKPCWTTR